MFFLFSITLLDYSLSGDLYTENAIFFQKKLAARSTPRFNEHVGMRRYWRVHNNYRLASWQANMSSSLCTLFM